MRELKSIPVAAIADRGPGRGHCPATIELSLLLSPLGFDAAVTAGKFLDATRGIDELLFAGKKGMTSGTNTNLDIATCRAGVIDSAARAHHIGLVILWMNACFHLQKGARNLIAHMVSCKR
jgi:hypothetical protein